MDIYPSLTYRDLDGAAEFLERAFGLTVDERVDDKQGALRLATVGLGDGRVLLQPDLPDELHGSHVGQAWVYVAVAEGGRPLPAGEGGGRGDPQRAPRRLRWGPSRLQRSRP